MFVFVFLCFIDNVLSVYYNTLKPRTASCPNVVKHSSQKAQVCDGEHRKGSEDFNLLIYFFLPVNFSQENKETLEIVKLWSQLMS